MSTPMELSALLHTLRTVEINPNGPDVNMGAAAKWYAEELRWPVFPIVARGKKPLSQHGFQNATTDLEDIAYWWNKWPDANIATATGHNGCGYDVIDIDGDLGMSSVGSFADELPDIRAIAYTPGDGLERGPGRHLYVPCTGDGNAVGFAPGCDYRGAGGYVVLPPSTALHGVRYAWIQAPVKP